VHYIQYDSNFHEEALHRMRRVSFFLSAIGFLMFASSAHAYLDPGSGSMVLQVILGGVVGLLMAIKIFWHRILEVLRIRPAGKNEQSKKAD
jgi:hypothetical protein